MTVRVEVVTPCDICNGKGTYVVQSTRGPLQTDTLRCRKGPHRRTFTEWPPEAIEAAVTALTDYCDTHDVWNDADMAGVMLAAAWGHITGDNK